ncbi:FAST kinase domain-containing protein 5, mitochondrial-like [Dermacentor variabilis]|uniref:FAST kinase domain-containing protein 5, mitochondrial-like n=1 Tax=Dermacentor variabilis TaxID=34621 RepID=UPI003F5BDD3C
MHVTKFNTPQLATAMHRMCQFWIFRRALHGKIHRELENEYFHEVLERQPDLKHSVMTPPNSDSVHKLLRASLPTVDDSVRRFVELSVHTDERSSCIENKEHKPIIETVVASLPAVSNDGLKCALAGLCLWPQTESTTTPHFKQLWNALDNECSARCSLWDKHRQLLLADCFYHLRLSRISKYNRTMLNIVGRSITKLTPRELIQYLYFTNLQRRMVRKIKPAIEGRLLSSFDVLSVAEIGLVCQSFFKSQEVIEDKRLMARIVKSFEENVVEADSILIGAVAKSLRYSRAAHDTSVWDKALIACEPAVAKWAPATVAHVMALATALKNYHPVLLDTALQHLMAEITTVRLKEITRTLKAVALFNHNPAGFDYKSVLHELSSLHRKAEIELHHHTFVSALWYLAVLGIYSADLLLVAMNDDRMHGSCKHKDVSFHAEALQSSVQIELPQYTGPFLSLHVLKSLQTERHIVGRDIDEGTKGLVYTEQVTLEVVNRLQTQFGDVCTIKRTLPHHHYPDILLCVEQEGKLKPSKCELQLASGVWRPCKSGTKVACAVVVHGPGSYCTNTNKLLGIEIMKLRQLRHVGYKVIEVPHFLLSQMSRIAFDSWIEQQLQVQRATVEISKSSTIKGVL